jgi:hypothetical protein
MVAEHSTILFSRNRLYHYQRTRPLTLSIQVTVANAAEGMAIMSKLMAARWEPTADAI